MSMITRYLQSLSDIHPVPLPYPASNARQGDEPDRVDIPLVVGASLAGVFLSSLLVSNLQPRPKLENHPMCGITTGGRVGMVAAFYLSDQVIAGGVLA